MKKKMILFLLPQLIMATTIGTNVRMERLKPFAEISIQPHKNLAFNTKISYNSFEQNIEAKYKVNEYVELTGEAFVGYENIKEDNTKAELKKYEAKKEKLEKLKNEIQNEDDISKVVEKTRELKDETDIQDLVKDKVTRKDVYKELKKFLESKGNAFGAGVTHLEEAINSDDLTKEKNAVVQAMIAIRNKYSNYNNNDLTEGANILNNGAFNGNSVNNDKVKEAFEKFYNYFEKNGDFSNIKDDFKKVADLYNNGDIKKNEIKNKVDASLNNAKEMIEKIQKGQNPNLVLTRRHIYYGAGVGANLNYNDFELRVKGRLGASTYIVKVDADLNTETTLYWSIESAIRYNIKVNKFTIYPEIGMKYIGAKYGQKGFIPYGSIGLNYTF